MNTNNGHILQKENVANTIYSITPFTLLDYPDKAACILWFAGCNMRCLYCYNPDIVLGKGKVCNEEALKFIASRKGLLDGVVFSGGECTLHKSIFHLTEEVKKMNMLVKIDTNGSNPKTLKLLIQEKLVDYIALDFKGTPPSFQKITQSHLFDNFEKTLEFLLSSTVKFEIRTTVHSDLITEQDIVWMRNYLEGKGYSGKYYIQNALKDIQTLGDIKNQNTIIPFHHYSSNNINLVVRN